MIFWPKFQSNFTEPHESSNTGRKFANLTTKFRLEFIRTETKIQEPNRNIVILKMCRLAFRILMNEWNQQLYSSLNLTCKHNVNETVQVTQVSRKEKIKLFTIQKISQQISDHSGKQRKKFPVFNRCIPERNLFYHQ